MKNKWLAAALNILPGAGYLYLGVRTPFAVLLLLMLPVVIIAGVADPAISNSSDSSSTLSWGIIAILLTPMIAFMVDAFNEAGRVNNVPEKAKVHEEAVAHEAKHKAEDEPQLFVVGVTKFVLLSVLTWSLYTTYWFYKNWKAVAASENIKVRPVWRAIWAIFFVYPLLKKMQAMISERDSKVDLSALDRSVLWIAFSLSSSAWKPLLILDLVKPFALMGVQKKVNSVYAPDQKISNRLNGAEWTIVIAGTALAILVLVGLFLPPTS